jgi:hypothetical protein
MRRIDVERRPELGDRFVRLELAEQGQAQQDVRIGVARHQPHSRFRVRRRAREVALAEEQAGEIALRLAVAGIELDRASQARTAWSA